MYFLGQIAKKSADLGQICTPILERIRDETKETAHIFIREGIERVCFAQAEGTQSIRQSTKLGTHEPLCYGATGIVLLAFQKPEELGQSLAAMKDYCKDVNLQQLLMKIAITKDQGYCLKKETVTALTWVALLPRSIMPMDLSLPVSVFLPLSFAFLMILLTLSP